MSPPCHSFSPKWFGPQTCCSRDCVAYLCLQRALWYHHWCQACLLCPSRGSARELPRASAARSTPTGLKLRWWGKEQSKKKRKEKCQWKQDWGPNVYPRGVRLQSWRVATLQTWAFFLPHLAHFDSTHKLIPTAFMVWIYCVRRQIQISIGLMPSRMWVRYAWSASVVLVSISFKRREGWKIKSNMEGHESDLSRDWMTNTCDGWMTSWQKLLIIHLVGLMGLL